MRKLSYLSLIVIIGACALCFLQLPRQVSASGAWIQTYNTAGVATSTFNPGETVRVTSYAPCTPYYIIVIKPDGLGGFQLGPFTASGPNTQDYTNLSTAMGDWHLALYDVCYDFAIGYFHVTPFAPLGVIGILGVCFAGAGFKLRKRQ